MGRLRAKRGRMSEPGWLLNRTPEFPAPRGYAATPATLKSAGGHHPGLVLGAGVASSKHLQALFERTTVPDPPDSVQDSVPRYLRAHVRRGQADAAVAARLHLYRNV